MGAYGRGFEAGVTDSVARMFFRGRLLVPYGEGSVMFREFLRGYVDGYYRGV